MHKIQEKLLNIISTKELSGKTLREVGSLIGELSPQKVKHHLMQLDKKGFIYYDPTDRKVIPIGRAKSASALVSVPIVGLADCGPQTIFADESVRGYLKLSKKMLPAISDSKEIFALIAQGDSMNDADVHGESIESGDFVIVDQSQNSPESGDYVVSVIDGMANIKKYIEDVDNDRIILKSESTKEYLPIFIHEDDDFMINGKVIAVIKK